MKFFLLTFLAFVCLNFSVNAQKDTFSNYDFIGSSHNSGLNNFFSLYTAERVKKENLKKEGLNNFIASNTEIKDYDFAMKVFNHPIYDNNRRNDLPNLAASLLEQKAITKLFGSYLNKIDSLIDINYDAGPSQLQSSFKSFESSIIDDVALIETEKGILLSAVSINTFSSKYWNENLDILSLKWSTKDQGGPSPSEIMLKADGRKILKSDIAGGVSGGVAGAVIGGTVATPIGAVPGWVAGAITGAVGGSVYESVSQFLDWLF